MFMFEPLFSWFDVGGLARGSTRRAAVLALLFGLGACNPVETWRDWTGASQNDPDPDTTPNTKNLAAGETADYPNLATVPPPPIRAMTAADREKLTQSLIADRANARYTDEQLRAGFSSASAAPLPPPASSANEPGSTQPEQAGSTPTSSLGVSAATEPGGKEPAAAAAAPQPSLAPITSSAPATPPVKSAASSAASENLGAPSSSATSSSGVRGKKPAQPGEGLRKQGEPPEPGPMESNLEMPQARATPQPEQVQPAPQPPSVPPTPKVASTPPSLPPGLAAGGVLAPTPLAGAKGAGGFQPPPPVPELAPPSPSRSMAAGEAQASSKSTVPVSTPLTEIKFGGDSTSLTDKDKQTLETVLPIYQQNPGKVRIVGYAGSGGGAVEQLNSYRTALDRAQAVAAALRQAGIPSDKIEVEAAPGGANSGENRAEVLLEH
jgi:outer membrane protein OmpA-like peptidoglycan-associated protein